MPNEKPSLRTRVAWYKKEFAEVREIYGVLKKRWALIPHLLVWRQRYRAIYLINNTAKHLRFSMKDYGLDMDDPITVWRESSKVGFTVAIEVVLLAVTRKSFTISEVEVACEGRAGRTTVKAMLKTGVEMGLLTHDSKLHAYLPTDYLIKSAFNRMIVKMLDPKIIEFSRFVVMFDESRKNAELTVNQEEIGKLNTMEFEALMEVYLLP